MPFIATLGNCPARSRGILLPSTGYPYFENVTADVTNYNLRTRMQSAGWNGTTFVDATVLISSTVTIGSSISTTASFATGTLPTNSTLTIINNGTIVGRGGNGGNASAGTGSNGGDAINLNATTTIVNNGLIGGGGGGGGAGGSLTTQIGGSGGGGGAGNAVGTGGTGATGTAANGASGASGTLNLGGSGGSSVNVSSPVVILQSGTQYTSTAVYTTSSGANVYWWSISLNSTVTALGQSTTVSYSGRIGNKIFATYANNSGVGRSNYVGQYFWQDFTSGNSKTTATIPANIPSVDSAGLPSTTTSFNLVGYLWGGTGRRSNGTVYGGGYTDFAGSITANSTIWVICGGAGNRTGNQDSSREPDCRGKSYQGWTDQGGGLSGVFTADPLDGSNAPLLSAGSTNILGIAGGSGGSYSNGTGGGGGGSSGGDASSSSKNATGGTQSAGGSNVVSNGSTIRNATFMTGAVVQAGSTTAPGGGGYYGGGGTGGSGESGGGGGGSGYFRTSGGYSGQTIQATSTAPANSGSDYYPGNPIATGTSASSDGDGNRGQVRLYLR